MPENNPKIGLLATPTIGGGLIFLILANNLQSKGYDVTFYSDTLVELKNWFPNIVLKSLAKSGNLNNITEQHDLLVAKANLSEQMAEVAEFFRLCVPNFWGRSYYHKSLLFDHASRLKKHVSDKKKLKKLLPLTKADQMIFSDISHIWPLTQTMAYFCQHILGLHNVTMDNGIIPPVGLIYRKHPDRVVVHATSSTSKKNWPLKKYIKLAKRLKKRGWKPVFAMTAAERAKLKDQIEPRFPVPVFVTLDELAEFVYESGFMIGNDSGIGHLASCLNIPTLTITSVCSGKFRWRPGWGYGEIAKPAFKIKTKKNEYWQMFLTVGKVVKRFKQLVRGGGKVVANINSA